MKRTLLILSGGIESIPGIRMAREMGLHVVVSDKNPEAPGFVEADDRIVASIYHVSEAVSAAKRYHQTVRPIQGVICMASDVPLTAASIASELNLPGITVKAATMACDKLAMKRKFLEDDIRIPWFSPVDSLSHLRKIVKQRPFPLVLKPVDSRGARGVIRLDPEVDLDWAFGHSLGQSPTGRVMVETFLSGPQVSTESIILNGVAHTPGFADRNYEYLTRFAPFIIENGGDLPTRRSKVLQTAMNDLIQRAAKSMGIKNGVVKGDLVIHKKKPCIIELAARLSGGYFCSHLIPLTTGVPFVQTAIRLALGEKIDEQLLRPRFQKGVSQRYLFPVPGRVASISGMDKVARMSSVVLSEVRVKVGDVVRSVDCHPARAGVLIATADTRKEAIQHVLSAVRKLNITTEPVG